MTRSDLLAFMRGQQYAAQASSADAGVRPQAAVVGIVVTDELEVFFDTLADSRKAQNLRRNPAVAFVIGGFAPGEAQTVQYEGIADEPAGAALSLLQHLYFARFPAGPTRERAGGITYFRVRPTWIRFSDFTREPPRLLDFVPPAFGGG